MENMEGYDGRRKLFIYILNFKQVFNIFKHKTQTIQTD